MAPICVHCRAVDESRNAVRRCNLIDDFRLRGLGNFLVCVCDISDGADSESCLLDGHLLVSPHGCPSVRVCVLISFSYKDTSCIRLGSILMVSF